MKEVKGVFDKIVFVSRFDFVAKLFELYSGF